MENKYRQLDGKMKRLRDAMAEAARQQGGRLYELQQEYEGIGQQMSDASANHYKQRHFGPFSDCWLCL